MSKYLLIETKGPQDGGSYTFELGKQLKELRHDVTIYLLQDAVFAARRTYQAGEQLIQEAERNGLRILADAVSARQRGLVGDRVAKAVGITEMGELVDLLMGQADKAIWH